MKPKKYLGQHFLKNQNVARKIIEAANVGKNDIVLEVGPGKGVLTQILAEKAKKVIAVEKDNELAGFLSDKFKGQTNLEIVHEDILKIENCKLSRLAAGSRRSLEDYNKVAGKIENLKFKVVANIPYYITSRFLRQFLESDCQPSLMALMVQKEVAERIVAKDGKESLLSISVKTYGWPKIIAKVPAGNFFPPPKVDSAIILIDNISKDFFTKSKINEKGFFRLLKLGFSHKRKMLKNNLSAKGGSASGGKIPLETLQKCKIPALARPENLSLENWKCLYKTV